MELRRPTMAHSLRSLRKYGVPVTGILDIGVLAGTKPLMDVYPDVKHFLFEPVDGFFPTIIENYKNITFQLEHLAISDEDGKTWQVGVCADGTGNITHSHISDDFVTKDQEPQLVECKPVNKVRLDSIYSLLETPKDFLLKIDVDGIEMKILRGAQRTILDASVVVIEASLASLTERASFVEERGFQLFDMVDLSYYYNNLSQVDLIFVRNDIVKELDDLRPWETKEFEWNSWYSANDEVWDYLAKNVKR